MPSKPASLNILFTSVGRRVELLRHFRRAYEDLPLSGQIVALDIDPLAPALRVADRCYLIPPLSSTDYIPTLLEVCRKEAINLIFPLIDPDIPVLAAHRAAIEKTGARVAAVASEACTVTADKWQTMLFFQQLGLPVPRSWLPGQLDPGEADFPLFIKPRWGSAARYTYKVHNNEELSFFIKYVPEPIIQEFLPGPEITNDIICDLEGEVLAVVSRQRIEVRWGEVAKGVTIYDPTISQACVRIAEGLPAVGPVTAQCIMKDGVGHFTEINARLGGGIPLGIVAGADSPRWLLARAAGLAIAIPPLGSYRRGLYLTRFDESFYIDETERNQMGMHHL